MATRTTARERRAPDTVGEAVIADRRRAAAGALAVLCLATLALRRGSLHADLVDVHLPTVLTLSTGLTAAGVALWPRTRHPWPRGEVPLATFLLTSGVVYLLAWGGSALFLDAVFWDDRTLVGVPDEPMVDGFRQNGLPWLGYLHLVLLRLGPWVYRVLTWAAMLGVGLGVRAITRRVPGLTGEDRWLAATLVLVLPFYVARHALITLPYTLSLALFVAAWWLLVRRTPARTRDVALATLAFVASFTTQSLLVFVVVPVAHLLLLELGGDLRPAGVLRWAWRRWYLLAAPVGFYAAKSAWFAPSGLYEGYNRIAPGPLAAATLRVLLLAAAVGIVVLRRDRLPRVAAASLVWLLGGLLLAAIAELPYLAAGHRPSFAGWESRHQLLVPFGWATVGVGVVRLVAAVLGPVVARRLGTAAVAVSVLVALAVTGTFLVDARKQDEVIALLRDEPRIATFPSVVVRDETIALNANRNRWPYYELNALFGEAYGDTARFVVPEGRSVARLRDGEFERVRDPRYHAAGSTFSQDAVHVRISTPDGPAQGPVWPFADLDLVLTTKDVQLDELGAGSAER